MYPTTLTILSKDDITRNEVINNCSETCERWKLNLKLFLVKIQILFYFYKQKLG
jgi:hypothetical protein